MWCSCVIDKISETMGDCHEETQSVEESATKSFPLVEFESFAWSEEKEKVKIYVDFPGAADVPDSDIRFVSFITCNFGLLLHFLILCKCYFVQNWTEDSLDLRVDKDGKTFVFEIDALFDKVATIKFTKKSSKFILTLIKARERIWYKLRF